MGAGFKAAVTAGEISTTKEKPGLLYWTVGKTFEDKLPPPWPKDRTCKGVNLYEKKKTGLRME